MLICCPFRTVALHVDLKKLLNYWSLQDADGSFPAESVPAWASDFLRSFDWDEDHLRCFLDAALGP